MIQSLREAQTDVKWVHYDAMLANGLTKKGERWQFDSFFRSQNAWRLVHDERFTSARNRRRAGMQTLEQAALVCSDSDSSETDCETANDQ